jgi:hypothetical protein
VGLAACNGPTTPQPPGGGPPLDLDFAYFALNVEPIFGARGCARTNGCHGGQGAGMLLLSGGTDIEEDFRSTRPHTRPWDPSASPLVRKPLAAAQGGVVHGGGEIFADTTDADYRTLIEWISGATEPPSAPGKGGRAGE